MATVEIHYAVEVETGGTYDAAAVGMSYGVMRYVTDRPDYDGTETGDSYIPVGDHSVIKINLGGAETLSVSIQSGEIWAASNGDFKSANSLIAVGDRFTVLDASDFTGGELATAKGSAPAEGDMFQVTNNTASSEAVTYVGKNIWYEGFLTRDGMSNPGRRVDLEGTGAYGTLSGFNFQLDNAFVAGSTNPIWRTLNANDVYLNAKKVRVYAIIDDVFYQIWTGVIDNNPMTETDYKFVCKSNFKQVHTDFPPATFNANDYPNSIAAVQDEPVPVCIGDVIYAGLKNVSGEPQWTTLIDEGGVTYNYAMGVAYTIDSTGAYLELNTRVQPADKFTANELAGRYLFIASGSDDPDTETGIRIIANDATDALFITKLQLAATIGAYVEATHGYNGGTSTQEIDRWQFRIGSINTTSVASNEKIVSFKTNSASMRQLWDYETNNKKYSPADFVISGADTEDATYNDTATMDTVVSEITKSGDVKVYYPIPISSIVAELDPTYSTTGTGADVTDFDRSTYVETSGIPPTYSAYNIFYCDLDINDTNNTFDELYFGIDASNPDLYAGRIIVIISYKDQYTRTIPVHNDQYTYTNAVSVSDFNMLPNDFYRNATGNGDNGETSRFETNDGVGTVQDLCKIDSDRLAAIKAGILSRTVKVSVYFRNDGGANSRFRIKQVGFHAYKTIDITGTTLYTRVAGEYLADGSTESNTVYNAYRRMLEDYDGLGAHQINYGNLATTRHNWYVGRQITDKKNMAAYVKELAEQSFVAVFQDRVGKIHLNAWRDDTTTALNHDNTNIVRESISNWKLTSIDKVFNNFTLQFSPNPAENKFFDTYQIKDVDVAGEDSNSQFPWLWTVCNTAFDVYGVKKEFKKKLEWFNDRTRWYNTDDSPKEGIGYDAAAYKFLENAVYWLSRQKRNVTYRLPITTANATIELTTPVYFRDTIYTNADTDTAYLGGSIYHVEYDIKNDQVIVSSILYPNDAVDDLAGDIIETGSQTDTITESGSQTDTYTEGA